jgi:hypothetical protein
MGCSRRRGGEGRTGMIGGTEFTCERFAAFSGVAGWYCERDANVYCMGKHYATLLYLEYIMAQSTAFPSCHVSRSHLLNFTYKSWSTTASILYLNLWLSHSANNKATEESHIKTHLNPKREM